MNIIVQHRLHVNLSTPMHIEKKKRSVYGKYNSKDEAIQVKLYSSDIFSSQ